MADVSPPASAEPPKKAPPAWQKPLLIGCGGLGGLFLVLMVLGIVFGPAIREEQRVADSAKSAQWEHRQDSIATAKRVADSVYRVEHADEIRQDSIAKVRDSVEQVERRLAEEKQRKKDSLHAVWKADAERRAARRAYEASTRPRYSNGREIHVGPRGGRYYINSRGEKQYVDD